MYLLQQANTSLTIPDTQADTSLGAGDVSRIPDTQQPMSDGNNADDDDDQTMDPGSQDMFCGDQSTVLVRI